jgi:hypothetical protein
MLYYHHCHSSAEEAIEAYKLFKSKKDEKKSNDDEDSDQKSKNENKSKIDTTKETVFNKKISKITNIKSKKESNHPTFIEETDLSNQQIEEGKLF